MQNQAPVYNFTVAQNGDFHEFSYQKTPLSFKMAGPLCMVTLVPAALLTLMSKPDSGMSGLVTWAVLMVGMAFGLTWLINRFRKPGAFAISDKEVVIGEKRFDRSHISSWFIQNPKGGEESYTTTRIVHHNPLSMGSNIANIGSGIGAVNADARRAVQRHMAAAGYKIFIRFGTKNIKLASGLGETEADVLFDKIKEVADLV